MTDLERVWGSQSSQVFRTNAATMLRSSLRWFAAIVFGGLDDRNPKALLDNESAVGIAAWTDQLWFVSMPSTGLP